jgi:hypothetical protein
LIFSVGDCAELGMEWSRVVYGRPGDGRGVGV